MGGTIPSSTFDAPEVEPPPRQSVEGDEGGARITSSRSVNRAERTAGRLPGKEPASQAARRTATIEGRQAGERNA